ncbi:MAG: ribonuclease R [Burkholderiales bacterium]|nr:ribonuclease R [Burkholderiales bacterium]
MTRSRKPTPEPGTSPRRARGDADAALIPSRDDILRALAAGGVPMPPAELARELRVHRSAQEALAGRLAAMERDGQLLTNRKGELCVVAKLDLVVGLVQGHPDGFGFLLPEDGSEDFFLGAREMHKALHGDRVVVRMAGYDRRGRREGEIVEVLNRANREVVGRLHAERGVHFIVAENRRINQDFLVPEDGIGGAKVGEIVVAEIVEQPTADHEAVARVTGVLGNATDPGIEIEIALRKHALPFEFGKEAQRQAKRLPQDVRPGDRKGRVELTGLPLVTIDGETAKDFDDAVYCERKGSNFRLVVAIADVAHYVREGDAIDRNARERGTSVYFPRRVIPMLPEELSNELCSLKPDVDRLCMACDMEITPLGAIKAYRFYPAVLHSRARLTYTQAWDWLSNPKRAKGAQAKALLPHLTNLYSLYEALAAARTKRGAIDFETTELAIEFDEHGKIAAIVPAPRNDAHKLIEECMLAANVCAADFLAQRKQMTLFRVHEPPPPEKLAALREFLSTSALHLAGGEKPTAADYAKLLASARDRPDFDLLQTVLLRSLSQAQYRPDNGGHFGLAYEAYAHFTSPIRRYPDLLVHRAIKAALSGQHYTPADMTWQQLGVHTSMTERRADDASRDVVNWLKCYYMQDHVGKEFEGTISGVTNFGLFVTLDGLMIDGLVHVTELGRDYFHFDAARHALVGERSGVIHQLAGRVRVVVARVDMEQARIEFTPAQGSAALVPAHPVYAEPLSREDRSHKGRAKRPS